MLFLLERPVDTAEKGELAKTFDDWSRAVAQTGGEVIEIQVSATLGRAYLVAEHQDRVALEGGLRAAGLDTSGLAQVRLVGAELADVKASRGGAQYLVEWDFPPDLTMDRYLTRKKEKSPLYAQVPDVTFLRTYVREDMVKCLCLYDGESVEAIKRAREVVGAPVTRLSELVADQQSVG